MSKNYSQEYLDDLTKHLSPIIVQLRNDDVYIGILTQGFRYGHYYLRALNINDGGIGFSRSMIKRIIYFNGLIVPKEKDSCHKILNLIQLNDLVNQAGYEFI